MATIAKYIRSYQRLAQAAGTSYGYSSGTACAADLIYLNKSGYSDISAIYYSTVLHSTASQGTLYSSLYDVTNSQVVSGSEVSTTSTSDIELRSGDITANLGNNLYNAVFKATNGGFSVNCKNHGLVIVQNGSISATETYYPLFWDQASGNFSLGGSYVEPVLSSNRNLSRYNFRSSAFDGTVSAVLEVIFDEVNGPSTAFAMLYDGSGNAISGTEVSSSSSTPVRLSGTPFTPIDGTEYQIRWHGGANPRSNAYFRIIQTGTISKTESYIFDPLGSNVSASYARDSVRLADVSFKWIDADFDTSPTFYNGGAITSSSATATAYSAINGTLGEITTTSTTPAWNVSSSISLTNNTNYAIQGKTSNTSFRGYFGGTGLIIASSWAPPATSQTILGKARVTATTLQTILGKSRITSTVLQTILGKSRVTATTSQTILGKAYISAGENVIQTILVSPADTSTTASPITFVWDIPSDSLNNPVHAQIQVDNTDNTFSSLEYDLNSVSGSGFEYYNGSIWTTYPTTGVISTYYGNQARISLTLVDGTKYWRVRGFA